jgi:hypothetical protein
MQQYGQQLTDDKFARDFKRYAVFQLKRNLPPGPGRPPYEAVTKAIQLRSQGMSWDAVYLECIPGFKGLPSGKRQVLKSELRSRCRSRRNTARRRKKARHVKNPKRISDSKQPAE